MCRKVTFTRIYRRFNTEFIIISPQNIVLVLYLDVKTRKVLKKQHSCGLRLSKLGKTLPYSTAQNGNFT